MSFQAIIVEKEDGIATITLNRPEARNALDMNMRQELLDAIADLRQDDNIRVVIMTGAGSAFCAGGDIRQMEGANLIERRARLRIAHEVVRGLVNLPKPVLSAVNGIAAGAGCSLALAADICIAADNARFSQAFVRISLVPDCGGMYFLPRLVGMARAKELFFTGEAIDAKEAERIGLVNKVVPAAELLSTVKALAQKLTTAAPLAIAFTKQILNQSAVLGLDAVLEYEVYAQGLSMQTQDHAEGIKAFKEKREPRFAGK